MAVVLSCPASSVQTVRCKELAAFSGAADRCRQAGRTDWATYRQSKVCCCRQTGLHVLLPPVLLHQSRLLRVFKFIFLLFELLVRLGSQSW